MYLRHDCLLYHFSLLCCEVSRLCSLSLTDCVLFWNAQSAASRHCADHSVFIPSLSQVQVGPLSAVPRHPLVPPAALTPALTERCLIPVFSGGPIISRRTKEMRPPVEPRSWGLSEVCVCGNGSPYDFFRKSAVSDAFLLNPERHRAKSLRWRLWIQNEG